MSSNSWPAALSNSVNISRIAIPLQMRCLLSQNTAGMLKLIESPASKVEYWGHMGDDQSSRVAGVRKQGESLYATLLVR